MQVTINIYWLFAILAGFSFGAFLFGRLRGELVQAQQYAIYSGGRSLADLYQELIMQVGNKYPNETRHQTALRYLRNAEQDELCLTASDITKLMDLIEDYGIHCGDFGSYTNERYQDAAEKKRNAVWEEILRILQMPNMAAESTCTQKVTL